MKIRIYAILLLFSFLVVLGHEMIPHHHHEVNLADITAFYNHNEHLHHETDDHSHHDVDSHKHNHSADSEKDHNHTFPFHHHLSADYEFNCLRIETNRISAVDLSVMCYLNSISNSTLDEPPDIDLTQFTDIPFKIKPTFEPGANGLRAPPSIA